MKIEHHDPHFSVFTPDHKYRYAVFSNIAVHNIRRLFELLQDVIKATPRSRFEKDNMLYTPNENAILYLLEQPGHEKEILKINKYLHLWLPWSAPSHQRSRNPKDISGLLKKQIDFLVKLRKYFSHFHTIPLAEYIEDKKAFKSTNEPIYDLAMRQMLVNFGKTEKEPQKPFIIDSISTRLHPNPFKQKDVVSELEIIFILSLFLEKRDVEAMLSNVWSLKNATEPYMRANRLVYSALSMRLPAPKITSSDLKDALFLDTLNELNRVPRPLIHLLKEDAVDKLNITELTDDSSGDDLPDLSQNLTMVRKRDRFSYLTLQCLEHTHSIPNIGFAINMGNRFIKAPYTKNILGEDTPRELKRSIISYGHLNAYHHDDVLSSYRSMETKDGITHRSFKPPLAHFGPSYQIENNTLALRIFDDPQHLNQMPDIGYDKPPVYPHPDYILSMHDLPQFSILAVKDQGKSIIKLMRAFGEERERFLIMVRDNTVQNWKHNHHDLPSSQIIDKFLRDNEFNLFTKHHIPGKIRKYLTDNHGISLKQSALDRLQKWYSQTALWIEQYETPESINSLHSHQSMRAPKSKKQNSKNEEKFGQIVFFPGSTRSMKKGHLATWLAKDIVNMAPVRTKKKLNKHGHEVEVAEKLSSAEFQMIEGKLAYYSRGDNARDMGRLFHSFGLLSGQEKHPFLQSKLFEKKEVIKDDGRKFQSYIGIKAFFYGYLQARLFWLRQAIEKIEKSSAMEGLILIHEKYPMLKSKTYNSMVFNGKNEDEALAKYAGNILHDPVFIPTGLFNKEATKYLKHLTQYNEDVVKINTTFLLGKLYPQMQWYYHLNQYKVPEEKGVDKVLPIDARYELFKDRVLWHFLQLISKNDHFKGFNSLDLSAYTDPASNAILELQGDIELNVLGYNIRIPNCKIKDSYSYRYMIKDQRLHSILQYYPAGSVLTLDEVKRELADFETHRLGLVRVIFEKESNYRGTKLQSSGESYIDIDRILKDFNLSTDQANDLKTYRNGALHNYLPSRMITFSRDEEKTVSRQVWEKGKAGWESLS